jgi:hypothetical protein
VMTQALAQEAGAAALGAAGAVGVAARGRWARVRAALGRGRHRGRHRAEQRAEQRAERRAELTAPLALPPALIERLAAACREAALGYGLSAPLAQLVADAVAGYLTRTLGPQASDR